MILFIFFFTAKVPQAESHPWYCDYQKKMEALKIGTKKLSRTWQLEVIGADLAKEFTNENRIQKVTAGILETGLSFLESNSSCNGCHHTSLRDLNPKIINHNHPNLVIQLLHGDWGAANKIVNVHEIVHASRRRQGHHMGELLFSYFNQRLRVLNISLAIPQPKNLEDEIAINNELEEMAKLDSLGVILITAGGNSGESHADLFYDKQRFPGVVVGGIDFTGNLWSASQYGQNVNVLAPSAAIFVPNSREPHILSHGTSLAAPLVSGSVVNALEVLPEMSRKNVELLIKNSSTKLTYLNKLKPTPRLLNSFKMVKIADRVKSLLSKRTGLKTIRQNESFISHQFTRPEILDFSEEANVYLNKALFIKDSSPCIDLVTKNQLLRKSHLLHPSSVTLRELAKNYQLLGYKLNSEFLKRVTNY